MIEWSKAPNISEVDLLVFGAHPDDAELMCSGTLSLLSQTKTTAEQLSSSCTTFAAI